MGHSEMGMPELNYEPTLMRWLISFGSTLVQVDIVCHRQEHSLLLKT